MLLPFLLLTGCLFDSKSQSERNSQITTYRYGDAYEVKQGLFRGYGCILMDEYETTIWCKVILVRYGSDFQPIQEQYITNQNFQKSNVTPVEAK